VEHRCSCPGQPRAEKQFGEQADLLADVGEEIAEQMHPGLLGR
jgi:hypothetical protein